MSDPSSIDRSDLSIERLFSVNGIRAMVTGGSRGIGRMIAEGLVVNGADVIIAARTADEVHRSTEEVGRLGSCSAVVADVATDEGRAALVRSVAERGPLHLLVNNAGSAIPEQLGNAGAETAAEMLALNLTAPFLLTQTLLPALREAASVDHVSRVVMIRRSGSKLPSPPAVWDRRRTRQRR